jgi:hypothetical protein
MEAAAEVGGILLASETHALVRDWVEAEEGEPLNVKGFARPVRTFKLRNVRPQERSLVGPFQRRAPHLSLTMALDAMSEDERRAASAALNEALDEVEGRSRP